MNADQTTRRQAMIGTIVAGSAAVASLPGIATGQDADAAEPAVDHDRESVLAAGMTDQEADCWAAVARAGGAFFALPELHPADAQEVATAIHIIQNKLLSRPTYRKYLAEAKSRR